LKKLIVVKNKRYLVPFGVSTMNKAYLLIGGNMGNRESNLQEAENKINLQCGTIIQSSHLYQTAAWGLEDQPAFLNKALFIETALSAHHLLHCILQIETGMGRKREIKFGPRLIDIDILFFNEEIIQTKELTVPHPELPNRRFALQCLADIAPTMLHPILRKSVDLLLKECTDPLPVHKI